MASYYITETPDVDWTRVNWDNLTEYKYRHESTEGYPVAQEEFDRRCQANQPAVMWRFDDNQSPPTEVARCNV